MRNTFGETLKILCNELGISETELAEELNYDVTYMSKWFSGSKLPAYQNRHKIIDKISKKIVSECEKRSYENDKTLLLPAGEFIITKPIDEVALKTILIEAYDGDYNYQSLRVGETGNLSFVDNKEKYLQLLKQSVNHLKEAKRKRVSIISNFDFIDILDDVFDEIMHSLNCKEIKEIELVMFVDMEKAMSDYQRYCRTILDAIVSLNHIELTLIKSKSANPPIMLVDDMLFVEILYRFQSMFAACYSTNEEIIEFFRHSYEIDKVSMQNLLDYTEPKYMRKTNVQIDCYTDERQRYFFNEAPALLIPQNVINELIETVDDEEYAKYLSKLGDVFDKHTSKSHMDLVVYSSMLNDYVSTGEISIGNVAHRFTKEQVKSHIEYISDCMTINPNIHLYVYRDTIRMRSGVKRLPSVFLNRNSLAIENSLIRPNESYHISVDEDFQKMFGFFFDDLISDPYCNEITPEALLRYL